MRLLTWFQLWWPPAVISETEHRSCPLGVVDRWADVLTWIRSKAPFQFDDQVDVRAVAERDEHSATAAGEPLDRGCLAEVALPSAIDQPRELVATGHAH